MQRLVCDSCHQCKNRLILRRFLIDWIHIYIYKKTTDFICMYTASADLIVHFVAERVVHKFRFFYPHSIDVWVCAFVCVLFAQLGQFKYGNRIISAIRNMWRTDKTACDWHILVDKFIWHVSVFFFFYITHQHFLPQLRSWLAYAWTHENHIFILGPL